MKEDLEVKKGKDGKTPTIKIGKVITGKPGSKVKVKITGKTPNFILNLVLPQGPVIPIKKCKKKKY